MKIETWQHCYDDSWKGFITNDAFAHPAKMARGLVRRIFDELFAMEALRKGEVVLDPFGGVGTTGIEAASRGVQAYLVELEERFVRFVNGYGCPGLSKREWIRWFGRFGRNQKICPACQGGANNWYEKDSGIVPEKSAHRYKGNFELHEETWALLGKPRPIMLQGDSRKLRHVLLGKLAECVVSSPPYAKTQVAKSSNGVDLEKQYATYRASGGGASFPAFCTIQKKHSGDYGDSDGQLSQMPEGRIDTVVSSPPYNLPMSQDHNGKRGGLRGTTPSEQGAFVKYGNTDGQLEGMPMGDIAAVISSPPFSPLNCQPVKVRGKSMGVRKDYPEGQRPEDNYGNTAGQLGAMPQGSVAAVVSSPPYAGDSGKSDSTGHKRAERRALEKGYRQGLGCFKTSESYGRAAGQLGAMPAGEVDAVVSSPPYEGALGNRRHEGDQQKYIERQQRYNEAHPEFKRPPATSMGYNGSEGNIANEYGETFWEAARDIVLECYAILKPGGIAVWVVKDFVRDKKRVRFSDDWIKLCEACGFKLIRHARAMLVKETRTHDLFGGEIVKKVERKSFFRRLHEQKLPAGDERRIDHEDVVFFVKN